MTPSTLPASVRVRLAQHAAVAVEDASTDEVVRSLPGPSRGHHAVLATLGALHHDLAAGDRAGLDAGHAGVLRKGLGVLIDAAEDVTHGAVGELTEAGIAAARKRAKCACDETLLRVLAELAQVAVQAAYAGLRRAGRL